MKTTITAALIFIFLGSFSGCQYLKKKVVKTEKTEYTLNATGKVRIEVENLNGNVDLIPSNDTLGIVYVTAEKTGKVRINETDKPIEGIDINIDTSGGIIRIETNYRNNISIFNGSNKHKVNYKIKVPSGLNVYINLTNGTINADGLFADSKFETVNGPVYINKCTGTINVETVNGSIKANIDSIKGLSAETVNGSITIGGLKNANAYVDASCVNGKVKTENLNFSTLSSEKKSLTGRLGTGKNQIRLSTVNGSIKLNGEYVSYNKKGDTDFNFKFDFNDDDGPVKIEVKHSDEQKGTMNNPVDTIKKADSVKSK